MDVNEVIRIRVTITSVSPLDPGLRIEAWDRDIVFHDLLAEGRIDRQGRCELVFDGDRHRELFLDRRPDVFFRLFVGQRLLLDTRDSVICNLRPGLHEVVLRLPAGEPEQPEQPEQPGGEPAAVIRGRAVLSPAGARGLVITAYADAALKQRLGAAQVDPCGRFAIAVCAPAPRVWLGWEQGDHEGRSPLLQPLAADAPARLHVYRRSRGPAGGRGRFLASVRSASGRAAVSVPVALLEVSLQRCQLLGEALTDETGAARIRYDEAALYSDRPDLRVVVFDRRGTPLLESDGAAVVLPGAHARTQTRFARVAEVLRAEGLARGCELRPEDASYLAGRSGLPALDVAAHAAATALAPALEVPAEALFALASSAAPEPAAALEEAVAVDVASPELLERAAELVPRLAAAGSAWAAREDLGRGSLDDFLATQVADPSARARVAGIILERGGLGAVVETLREEALATLEVRFLVDLQALAGVDVGLARALGRRQKDGLPTGEDLALLGPGDWEHVLREAGGGADDPAALRRHAVTLARRTQRMFPDKVFRAQVERHADRVWAQQIGQYLEAHPGWRFRSTPPLEGEDGQGDAETTGLAALVAYQRIVRLTRDHRVVGALLDAGFTTAAELAAVGLPELVGRFANDFEGDVLLLREVHERARSTTAALNAASSFLPVGRRPSLCDCAHCRSIFGPAAYLFELLAAFRRYGLLGHLEARRPDLTRTHLGCANTTVEVPQIDLVNEILEDRILAPRGTSVAHGLPAGACLPPGRQTQGTSEERRAIPQSEPSAELEGLLAAAALPWSLPYDYPRDRARSARDRLLDRPETVALAVWRAAIASGAATPEQATRDLAAAMLDLGEPQARLISETSPLEVAWGRSAPAEVATGGVRLALLAEVAGISLAAVEETLDAAFVRGARGDQLSIEPDEVCSSADPPRLVGPAAALAEVLDRFHRFERLRRHLGWSVRDLDEALGWLGGALDAARLEQVGLLRFLERRLRLEPAALLALFRDPAHARPSTLRPRAVTSAFEALFGAGSATLALPDATMGDEERRQTLAAQIAQASGQPLTVVDETFAEGLLPPHDDAGDLLPLADAQAAYRGAVAASHRLGAWEQRLRLEGSALVEIVRLAGLRVLDGAAAGADRLRDAVRLIDLAERIAGLPVAASELAYLAGVDPEAERRHGLSASAVGGLLLELRRDLDRAREAARPLPADARAALRTALSRVLTAAAAPGAVPAAIDARAAGLAEALEWSAFVPARAAGADELMAHTVSGWPGLGSVPPPDPAARAVELDAALRSAGDSLVEWLAEVPGAPPSWPAAELAAASSRLESAVRAWLADPTVDAGALLEPELAALFAAVAAVIPPGLSARLAARAVEHAAVALEAQLAARAASILPVVSAALRRMQAREVVAGWLIRGLGASPASAELLLEQLSDPEDPGHPVIGALVDASGAPSARLAGSQVLARYFAAGAAGSAPIESRAEATLAFDWSTRPPIPALQGRPFAAELEVRVPAALLAEPDGSPIALVVEADGEVELTVEDAAGARRVLRETPGDQVRRFDVTVGVVTGPEALIRLRYATGAAGGARALRALHRRSDGVLDEIQWAALAPVVKRLHRAALALRGVSLPPSAWIALAPAPGRARAVELDRLAAGAPLAEWLAFFGLAALARRVRSVGSGPALVGLLSGAATARADALQALNVEARELDGALGLLGVADPAADPTALPPGVGFEGVVAALELVDQAARLHLPPSALARWHRAGPAEIYESALAALRVGLDEPAWWRRLAEVHDPVRERLRDAQVDFLLGEHHRGAPGAALLSSREAISDELLTDVQMSACMATSRIQFACSAVQRYVAVAQADRAPWPIRGTEDEERFAREWASLRQYRLHEAQMRVLVHAENWIEPALRPGKTPAFERLERTMSSGPLTLHLAERAMREYAAALAEVARLETIAVVTHDPEERDRPLAFRDPELRGTHVFARTRAHPQRLYYRRRLPLPDGRWTPWERVDADLEGTHYVAVVAFGRLRLLCADLSVARSPRPDQCSREVATASSRSPAGKAALTDYEVTLSWIDREHDRWSPVRRSGRSPFAIELSNPPDESVVFESGLPDHFGEVEAEAAARVTSVTVEVKLVGDGIGAGSEMPVYLKSDAERFHVGTFDGGDSGLAPRARAYPITRGSGIPGSLAELTRVRLEWWGARIDGEFTDDWNVDSIRVRFALADGTERATDVPTGRMGNFRTETDWTSPAWEDVSLVGASYLRLQGGHFETSWQAFEGALRHPLSLDTVVPLPSYFHMEYEVVPQSVDLGQAIAIQTGRSRPDSIDVSLHSVPHAEQGRIRSRFRVTEQALAANPELASAWGADWVTGREFCYTIETRQAGLATLRMYADDTVELLAGRPGAMGEHRGVRPEGQALLSATPDGQTGGPVYADERIVATSPVPYRLTVQRAFPTDVGETRLRSTLEPKILEEAHGAREPARSFFVERTDEMVPAESDPPLVNDSPRFDLSRLLQAGPAGQLLLPPGNRSGLQGGGLLELGIGWGAVGPGDAQAQGGIVLSQDRLEDLLRGFRWRFHTFWHPQAVGFRRLLESRGLPRLVRAQNQELSADTDLPELASRVEHFASYDPDERLVDPRWPRDVVDFTITGPFSEYNWELFFDSLLHIARRFDEEGHFDEADEIFALLVDRSRVAEPGAWLDPALFQTAPIRRSLQIESGAIAIILDERTRADILAQIERIRANPYQPHVIARGWPAVYARALRIRYAEHLIRAGEADFRRAYAGDNRAFLESASTRFDLAARVLGPAEDHLPASLGDEVACFASLTAGPAAEPADAIEALEPYLPDLLAGGAGDDSLAGSARWRFCVPANDRLDELRAVVADRLLKLRSCQDIDGVRRALSLYGARIDPALLVRATAQGMDLDVLLGRIGTARPALYFQALWQRALQACERARALEDAWLAAQERADGEAMALLQNDHELQALEGQREVMTGRLEDARALVEALDRAVESAELRREFYASRQRLNAQEEAEGKALVEAGKADARAAQDARSASDWAWIPTVETYADVGVQAPPQMVGTVPVPTYARAGISLRYPVGGQTGVQAHRANAEGHGHDAAERRAEASLVGRDGSFQRRADDWKLQELLALKDLQRGEHDRAGAEIRIRIAELELDLHRRRIDDARAVRAFLRDKLTSQEQHAWRADRLRALRYQQHRMAYELVSQARAALVREHGLDDHGPVTDPWDDGRSGVAAAAALLHELEAQQQLHLETWRREQEKLKAYSLVERDPLAYLELLQRGEAVFSIGEPDYDEDGAGDFFRRIRHVSLDIPAVRGPFTNVNARLTQLRGEVRRRAHRQADGDYHRAGPDDPRFQDDLASGESIVTSTGVQDDGRIDPQQNGEVPPPFCMNGAVSTFRIELSPGQNHFDRQTISDVILRIGLTSRAGGDDAAAAAAEGRRSYLADRPQPVMLPLHAAFSNAWHRFVDALDRDGAGELALTFGPAHIPLRLQPVSRIVQSSLYLSVPDDVLLDVDGGDSTGSFLVPPELRPATSSVDDPHEVPPIHRLRLRTPMVLGEERRVVFSRRSPTAALRRGWLLCWLEGAG